MSVTNPINNLMQAARAGISAGRMPHISINDKQFNVFIGADKRSIAQFDHERGATFIEFIVVGVLPHNIKIFHQEEYNPANPLPPECNSDNGVGPSITARTPQWPVCKGCPQDRWGSKLNQRGEQIKACTDKKRLVVIVPSYNNSTPLQFDIPPAAFKSWAGVIDNLQFAGVSDITSVIIRCYFVDNDEGYLAFSVSPLGYVEQALGPDWTPWLHGLVASETVAMLSGARDRPIDPAGWVSPQIAATAGAPALPAPAPQPQGQPQLQYAAPAPQPQPQPQYAAPAPQPQPQPQYAAPAPQPQPQYAAPAPQPQPQPQPQYQAPAPQPQPQYQHAAPESQIIPPGQPSPAAAAAQPVGAPPAAAPKRGRGRPKTAAPADAPVSQVAAPGAAAYGMAAPVEPSDALRNSLAGAMNLPTS